jgi:hypothetical protein
MNNKSNLLTIKIIHTTVWVFYNVVMFYLLYAVIADKIDKWVWICLSLFALEGLILVLFRNMCPLTVMARRFSDSAKDNFDIFLPNWLARYNKLIYSILLALCIIILIYRLAT